MPSICSTANCWRCRRSIGYRWCCANCKDSAGATRPARHPRAPRPPAAPASPYSTEAGDRSRLQGTWALIKVGERDATAEEKQASLGELTFRGDQLIDTFSSGGVREAPFHLDEA